MNKLSFLLFMISVNFIKRGGGGGIVCGCLGNGRIESCELCVAGPVRETEPHLTAGAGQGSTGREGKSPLQTRQSKFFAENLKAGSNIYNCCLWYCLRLCFLAEVSAILQH